MDIKTAKTIAKEYGVNSLLTKPDANPKVAKNGKLDVMASVLHLAPAKLSGYEVCPQRSAGCTAACLHTAGNPAYMPGKTKARIARTKFYFEQREAFLALLAHEIAALERKAHKAGMQPGVRLNGTSDIPWERVKLDGQTMMDLFPGVEFYDYTKVTKRAIAHARGQFPSNYHLTFSATESNKADVWRVLLEKGNVAAVFFDVPPLFYGYEVIDGDAHDFRPADPRGVIVGLKAKGDAKRDTSGFVWA